MISGTGTLTQAGLGTTVLIGNNTYAGGTTIGAGMLQLGNGGTTGSVVGDVLDDGALAFNRSDTVTYGGVISGVGSLIQVGPGTLILTGANTYTGGTTISGGTLQLGNGGTTGSVAGDIVNNTVLVFNNDDDLTFRGAISGSGSFTKAGAGTLILTKNYTYTGLTTISDGTLQIGRGSGTGSIAGNIDNNAALIFDRRTALTYGGVISGTGTLTKSGAGTLMLTGESTYTGTTTVSGGTLQIGDGGTTGSIAGNVVDNAKLVFDRSDELTYGGVISGIGSLTKRGEGVLTLTADNSYTGGTTIAAGGLVVAGSVRGPVAVLPNAFLGGTGSVGTTELRGTLSPGSSIGTITVDGDLTFGENSLYLVEVSPLSADRTNVTGSATLGGTVQIVSEPGVYSPGMPYSILSAGSMTGTFSGLTSDFASYTFLAPALTYDANNVYFSLARNATFASVGQTPNQIATGSAADTLDYDNPVIASIVWGTAEQTQIALDLLSGEIHASAASVLLDESHYVRDALFARLRHTDDDAMQPSFLTWAQAIGAWGGIESDGNAASLQRGLAGFITGIDTELNGDWRAGIAAGHTRSWFDVADRLSSGSGDNYHLALYGGGRLGQLGLRFGAAQTWQEMDIDRSVSFPGFAGSTTGEYSARTAQLFGEVGYGIPLGQSEVEPIVNLAYVDLDAERFLETGGAEALTGDNQFAAVFTTVGLHAATTVVPGDRMQVTLRGSLGWRHAFGDVTPEAAFVFAAGGEQFTIGGLPIARDALAVEAGFDFDVTRNAGFGLLYTGQFGANSRDHAVKASFTWRF